MTHVVGGVLGIDLVFLAVGYALLARGLGGLSLVGRLAYGGVALFAGTGAVGVAAGILAVLGVRVGLATLLGTSAFLIGCGAAAALLRRAGRGPERPVEHRARPEGALGQVVTLSAGTLLTGLSAVVLWGGFRSTPWLDDSWFFWLPKGVVLQQLGLDGRLFTDQHTYLSLTSPDYPLWWSIVMHAPMSMSGAIDLRAVNAQAAVLVVAFVAGVARLLWRRVRPSILLLGLLVVLLSPELLRQALGGGADVPLALALGLFAVTGGCWLAGDGFSTLFLCFVFGATALALKPEGTPELILLTVVLALTARGVGRLRLGWFSLAVVGALLTSLPWFVWRQVHGVEDQVSPAKAFDPPFLADRFGRVGPAASALAHRLFDVHSWLVLLPLVIALCVAAWLVDRRLACLAPSCFVAGGFALLVWGYWADTANLSFRLGTSAYRVVDPLMVVGGLSVPVLAEAIALRLGAQPFGRRGKAEALDRPPRGPGD